jgi:GNAT superfamily N-acetyltransferase
MEVTFRKATADDAAEVVSYLRAFAAFNKIEDEFTATEESVRTWMFERGAAEAVFEQVDGVDVGVVVYSPRFNPLDGTPGLDLACVYVDEEHRNHGLGRRLFAEAARIAEERGYGWVEWRSLDWNTRTSGLYYVLGAEQLNGWTLFHLANGQLKELAQRE